MVDKWSKTLYNYMKNQGKPRQGTHMSAYISTRDLHFQSIGRSFFQEISCLPEKRIPLMRIYDDACDEGFILVSHSTGMEIKMVLTETKRLDGDIISWTFKPVNKNAPIRNVVILND